MLALTIKLHVLDTLAHSLNQKIYHNYNIQTNAILLNGSIYLSSYDQLVPQLH
jgi:hypothetical protein